MGERKALGGWLANLFSKPVSALVWGLSNSDSLDAPLRALVFFAAELLRLDFAASSIMLLTAAGISSSLALLLVATGFFAAAVFFDATDFNLGLLEGGVLAI
jgi:hypothetical protein